MVRFRLDIVDLILVSNEIDCNDVEIILGRDTQWKYVVSKD